MPVVVMQSVDLDTSAVIKSALKVPAHAARLTSASMARPAVKLLTSITQTAAHPANNAALSTVAIGAVLRPKHVVTGQGMYMAITNIQSRALTTMGTTIPSGTTAFVNNKK